MRTPLHVGKAILDMAKMHTCRFYYEVLVDCMTRPIQLLAHDTDSFTIAMPTRTLRENCKYGAEWWDREVAPRWFDCPGETGRARCRTPGMFHLESSGHMARLLAPKMYIVTDEDDGVVKASHKGIRASCIPQPAGETFGHIIETGEPLLLDMPTKTWNAETGLYEDGILRRSINPPKK